LLLELLLPPLRVEPVFVPPLPLPLPNIEFELTTAGSFVVLLDFLCLDDDDDEFELSFGGLDFIVLDDDDVAVVGSSSFSGEDGPSEELVS
jgi:hypothetical protein